MVRFFLILAAVICVAGATFLGGYAASYFGVDPLASMAERVQNKVNELRGLPSEDEARLDVIETINLRLRGEIYHIERDEWTSGGALTVWGDDLLLMDRRGILRRFTDETGITDTAITLPDNGFDAYIAATQSEEYGSYQHRAFSMRYNDITYVDAPELHGLATSYTFYNPDEGCFGTRISWLDIPRDAAAADFSAARADWRLVFETNPCIPLNAGWVALDGIMAGGRMDFRAPSTMFLGSGEYHHDGVHTYDIGIQSPDTDYGKVVAIDLLTGGSSHVSIGHRNMQGMAVDGQGRVWVVEHGIRGGDELNLAREGENFGWPLETFGTLYSGQPYPTQGEEGRHVLHTPPVFAWMPSAGISSLDAIDNFHPTWDGDLLAGSLAWPSRGQSLFRIRVSEDGSRVHFVEQIRLDRRIRYVQQYHDRIAVLLDNNDIAIFRIEERTDPLGRALAIAAAEMPADVHAQVTRTLRSCAECHGFDRSVANAAAPTLAGVLDRPIGESTYEGYSDAMAGFGGVWSRDNLVAYLSDPDSFMPGTVMPAQGLEPGPLLDGLIDVLAIANDEAGYVAD